MAKSRAICVMCVGKGRYEQQLRLVEAQIREYAAKCRADYIVIDKFLDPEKRRNIYCQKLLIPDALREYDLVAFFDLDILIAADCPDIFAQMPESCGLMACLNPRGTEKFNKIYAGNARVLHETTEDYFVSRNFPVKEGLRGNINGGVLLFRPKLVADVFRDYYYSAHSQGKCTAHEEAPMAYYAQTMGLFCPLDNRFNCLLYFETGTEEGSAIYNVQRQKFYPAFNKVFRRLTKTDNLLLQGRIRRFAQYLADNGNYIIHFAGGYWNVWNYRKLRKKQEQKARKNK